MAFIRFQFEIAAQIARMAMMMTTANASNSSPVLGQKAIEDASTQNKWLFAVYMVFIVGAAVLTYLLWQSGNKVQSAIVADADARIAEANSTAAKANERTTNLEHDNLTLRTDLNTETGKVAGLQKDAADSKAAQQVVQIALAKQQERAALAERNLLILQDAIKPRHLSNEQKWSLKAALTTLPKASPIVSSSISVSDGSGYAQDFMDLFQSIGWSVPGENIQRALYSGEFSGLMVSVHNANSVPIQAEALVNALNNLGLKTATSIDESLPPGSFALKVGTKDR
jgi:hypothetical protein